MLHRLKRCGIDGFPQTDTVLTQGRDLFAAAMKLGQEGIMAKLLDGRYAQGRMTKLWKKIKPQRIHVR
jgi:ATP-dependent DNA ligase